jgi:hypothetical protein
MELPEQDRQALIEAARRRGVTGSGGAAFGVMPSSGKRPKEPDFPPGSSVLDVPIGGKERLTDTVLRRRSEPEASMTALPAPSMAQRHARSLEGYLTPKMGGPRARTVSQSLLGGQESVLPFGIGLQEFVPFSPYVGEEAGAMVREGQETDSGLTTGLGLGMGALQALPVAKPLARGAKAATMTAGRAGERLAERVVPEVMERGGLGAEMLGAMGSGTRSPLTAYHGTPHKFAPEEGAPLGKFKSEKIGTGEGAQAYGHGIYFAESPDVASSYQKALTFDGFKIKMKDGSTQIAARVTTDGFDPGAFLTKHGGDYDAAIKDAERYLESALIVRQLKEWKQDSVETIAFGDKGSLYTVDIPDEMIPRMLDWDKPLSQQSPEVQKALEPLMSKLEASRRQSMSAFSSRDVDMEMSAWRNSRTGEKLVSDIGAFSGKSEAEASDILRQAGIPGIQYLDAGSRDIGKGTRNFVVFPGEEEKVKILERKAEGGAVKYAEGGAVSSEDLSKPSFRYPSSGRRPEKLNVSRDVNAPVQLARGWAAGLLGLPGDIEGLVRMLPGIKNETPVLPTSDFYREYLPGYDPAPAARAISGLGALAGGAGATKVAGTGVKGAKAAGKALGPKAAEMAEGYLLKSGLAPSVIKPKGGNWLSGSVETATKPLKGGMVAGQTPAERIPLHEELLRDPALNADQLDRVRYQLDATRGEAAINNWIDTKLNKYIKNEMGTPEDPVRALAERGITHMQNVPAEEAAGWASIYRKEAGFPEEGMGQSPLARSWENIADSMIASQSAGRLRGAISEFEGAKTTSDIHAGVERTLVKERVRQLEDTFKNTSNKDLADEFNLDYEVTDANRAKAIEDWARTEVQGYFRGNAEDMLGPHYSHKVGYEGREAVMRGEDLGWLSKVPEDQSVYAAVPSEGATPEFAHLIDELRNAIRADSDLPANLRLKREDLSKVTVPQAIERVAKINDWRAEQRTKADLAKARNPATFTVKEYPEEGMQWVEMKMPEAELPQGAVWEEFAGNQRLFGPSGESLSIGATKDEALRLLNRDKRQASLAEALKYEGDLMGHCVGGYCPDVEYGVSRIYSLRDKKGEPRVTIEVKPASIPPRNWLYEQPDDIVREIQSQVGNSPSAAQMNDAVRAHPKYQDDLAAAPPAITQIKGSGKKDKAQRLRLKGTGYEDEPDAYLLPFVQDFVRSGNWSKVANLDNAGLIKHEGKYLTESEYSALLDEQLRGPNYARGGLVKDTDAIAAKLKATGMDDEKAFMQALRMADARLIAHP